MGDKQKHRLYCDCLVIIICTLFVIRMKGKSGTMATTNYNIRIEQDLRDKAFSVLENYGLAPAQAIKLFLKQVADTQTVPLSFSHHQNSSIPNLTTLHAMEEARVERKTAKTYATFEEAMQHLEDN